MNSFAFARYIYVEVWWLELSNLESLNQFVAEIDGSFTNGKQLVVEKLVVEPDYWKAVSKEEASASSTAAVP